jgi:hypothetical protein
MVPPVEQEAMMEGVAVVDLEELCLLTLVALGELLDKDNPARPVVLELLG